MSGIILDKVGSVWRLTNNPSGRPQRSVTQVYSGIRCAIVPISTFDAPEPYRNVSTHVVWVEHWLILRKEDEIRWGRRTQDDFNNVLAEVFTINGRRRFSMSVQLAAYYAREGE